VKNLAPRAAGALLVSLLVASSAHAGRVIDRILVRVNSRIITQSQLDNRMEVSARDTGGLPSDQTKLDDLRRSTMEELVNEALIEDRAHDLDIVTSDADVEDQIKRLKEANNVTSEEDFEKGLAQSGLTVDRLREQLKRTLVVQRVVGREVNSKVDLSDDALRLIYEREKETWKIAERAHIAEILIGREDNPARAEKKASEAATLLKSGTKWEQVVKEYSEGAGRDRGGDLGTVSKGELAPEIDKVVFSLPAGGVSDPVATKRAWHIVKLLEKFPVSYRPFNEVKAELLKREQETQFQKKLAEYLDKLKGEAVIRVSADASRYYTPPAASQKEDKDKAAEPEKPAEKTAPTKKG
jgi:parvulin-like peptidyl-prolyl isomerase